MFTRLASLSIVVLAAALTGCHSSTSTPGAQQQASADSSFPALPTSFTTATITDPTFNNILADTMTIPSTWKLEGTIMTAPCTTLPWPVYRAYSPDGLTEMRQMPALGWHWSANGYAPQGCLDLKQTISAADFLTHFIATLSGGIHVVGTLPVPAVFSQWAQNFANNLNNQPIVYAPARSQTTADTAALHIQTHNGSFIVDQRLLAVVICSVNNQAGSPLQGGSCWARVDVLRAPEGHLDPLIQLVDSQNLPKPVENPTWQQAVLARDRQNTQNIANQIFAMQRQAAATFMAMHQNFMRTMQQNFQSFQASQEDQFNHFQANMAAQSQVQDNAASDWVDVALDRQTVAGPDGVAHVSNQFAHTYSTTAGGQTQWFQTNDANANPNGVLPGNWTENTKVHGNGQPN